MSVILSVLALQAASPAGSAHTPLYADWAFWAAVVAAVAVVLSQLPPVYWWFKRAKLGIDLYSRVHLTHKVGNPNVQLHLILANTGGRSVKVRDVKVIVRRDGKEVVVLPAQTYVAEAASDRTVLFTTFVLERKEEWAHIVNFLNYFNRADDKKYKAAELALKNAIIAERKKTEDEESIVEVAASFANPFIAMFNEKFVWQPGEYEIRVVVDTIPKRARLERSYRFTLFESDSAELSQAKDDYASGDGIYWDSGRHPGVLVQLVEA